MYMHILSQRMPCTTTSWLSQLSFQLSSLTSDATQQACMEQIHMGLDLNSILTDISRAQIKGQTEVLTEKTNPLQQPQEPTGPPPETAQASLRRCVCVCCDCGPAMVLPARLSFAILPLRPSQKPPSLDSCPLLHRFVVQNLLSTSNFAGGSGSGSRQPACPLREVVCAAHAGQAGGGAG